MKVALVLERFSLSRGGAERSTYEMALALSAMGIDVSLIAEQINFQGLDKPPFRARQVKVTGITPARRWCCFERVLNDLIANSDYNIVHSMVPLRRAHVYQPRGGCILYSSRRHALSYNHPVKIWIKRATSRMNLGRQARIARERSLCNAPDGPIIAALSGYVIRQFKTEYALDDSKIRLVPNGVDISVIRSEQAKAAGQKLRKLYDRAGKLALFLFAAENLRLKGLNWLLQAAALAARQMTEDLRDFRILVVSGENYRKYWKQARSLSLNRNIIFMGPTACMPALLQMCDAVILPTYNDACSRLILEGLSTGKPAVTTRFNGAADFLPDSKYGFVIDRCDDIESLARALLYLCHPHRQQEMSRTIQADRLYEQVSMQRHARELLSLYEDLLRK